MNFRVPISTFKIILKPQQREQLVVVLTKKDPRKEEWGNYEVDLKVIDIRKKETKETLNN